MVHSSDVQHGPIAEFVPELDHLAVDAMADWKVPGAAIAVVQDGKVVVAKAYGQRDVEANLPVTATTQFLTCSITKSFTATAVALLHNEGRLDWTKPVRDYLPEFRLHDSVATDRVTIRLSAPLEPMVKDIVFVRLPAGDCTDADFRARCVGTFKGGPTTHRVTLDADGQLVLKPDNQPAYRLAPHHGRRFRIVELEGFFVEFRGEGTIVDEIIFHQPNGTFTAKRLDDSV